MPTRAAIYARSSHDHPLTAEQQIAHLESVAAERDWVIIGEFTDRPNTIRKGLDRRSGEQALVTSIREGKIDIVCICSICRLGKSLADLVSFLEACRKAGASLWIDDRQIDAISSDRFNLLDLAQL